MIIIIGDIHGDFEILRQLRNRIDNSLPITIIQIGDFGFYPHCIEQWPKKYPWPVYAIDGNHEHFPMLRKYEQVEEVAYNLFYVPRGSVLNIEGYEIGFLGGGHSIDKAWRKEGVDWFKDEEITNEQIEKLVGKQLDILITHNPPARVMKRNFPPLVLRNWGLPMDWKDTCSVMVDNLWKSLGEPLMFCGHMHQSVVDGNCRILDINEVYFLPRREDFKGKVTLQEVENLNQKYRLQAFLETRHAGEYLSLKDDIPPTLK